MICSYRYLFEIGIKDAGGFETSAINCHLKNKERALKEALGTPCCFSSAGLIKNALFDVNHMNSCSLHNVTEIGLQSLGPMHLSSSSCF